MVGELRQAEQGSALRMRHRLQVGISVQREGVYVAENDDIIRGVALQHFPHPDAVRGFVRTFLPQGYRQVCKHGLLLFKNACGNVVPVHGMDGW